MTLPFKIFLFVSLCAVNFFIGWSLKAHSPQACQDVALEAYSVGRRIGVAEAQSNGACIGWWVGAATADIRDARQAFCKGR